MTALARQRHGVTALATKVDTGQDTMEGIQNMAYIHKSTANIVPVPVYL